jgi:hypothetical protein
MNFYPASAGSAAAASPWQFSPAAYGAKGDGRVLGDVVLNATTTITSASAGFTSADVGKYIMIHGALGTTSGPLLTTIATVTNSTTVVLTSGASVSGSSYPAVYGTDDTAAINSALTAAGTYATTYSAGSPGSGCYFAEIVFASRIYILGAGPTQTTSPWQQNSQIVLPVPNVNGTTQKLVIALTGAGDSGYLQFWESLVPNVSGTALVSIPVGHTAPSTPSGTYGQQSVIGGPSAGGAFTGGYANLKVIVRGIGVWNAIYTNSYAGDFGYCSAMRVQQSGAHIFAPTGVNSSAVLPYLSNITATAFTNSIGTGWRTPVTANNDDIVMDDVAAEGYEVAFEVFDHFTAGRLAAIYSDVVMKWDSSLGASGVSHEVTILNMSAEVYNGGFRTVGSGGATIQADINWDAECTSVTYDVSDVGNCMRGLFRFRDPADTRFPTVTGAANLKVICDELGPGLWASPPSVPLTTVAQQNTSWRDATVYLTSGGAAVTVIKVDSTTTGLTLGASGTVAVPVPSGHTITLTYASTAPTWAWILN